MLIIIVSCLIIYFADTSASVRESSGSYDTYELVTKYIEVQQSSTRSAGGAASRAVDGDTDGIFTKNKCTHTQRDVYSNEWWYINLGSPTAISKVVIYNRVDCCANRLAGVVVRVGNNATSPFTGNQQCGPEISQTEATGTNPVEIECQPSVTGQYVTIYKGEENRYLTLCEVELYKDISNPVLTCPDDIEVNADIDQSLNPITWSDLEVHDNFHIGLSASCTPSSGSLFDVGFTKVTCTATDASGNNGNCSFVVHIKDDKKPSVICPNNITSVDQLDNPVTWSDPKVTDNVHTGMSANCVPSSGSLFHVGSTTINCTATDGSGNQGSCSFVVNVIGQTLVSADVKNSSDIVCPRDINVNQSSDVVTWNDPTLMGNVDEGLNITCIPHSGSLFETGSTKVTCSATDSTGKEINCWFSVNAPEELLPGNSDNKSKNLTGLWIALIILGIIILILVIFIVCRQNKTKDNQCADENSKKMDDNTALETL